MALSIGDSKVSKLYLGDTECKKAYLGDTLVLDNSIEKVFQWVASTLPKSHYWKTIAYGNGMFLAIPRRASYTTNTYATTTDGITWTAHTFEKYAKYNYCIYDGEKFIVLARNDSNTATDIPPLLYSSDGINWTTLNSPSAPGFYNGIAYGNGSYVIIPSSGTAEMYYSSDLFSWKKSSGYKVAYYYTDIAYGDGKFVVVSKKTSSSTSTSNKAIYSTDGGANWTTATLPASVAWNVIAFGNGMFVAAASGSATAAYSYNGIDWAKVTLPTSANWQSCTYGNGRFVLVATSSSTTTLVSDDGITFEEVSIPSGNWYDIAYGNGKFVTIGNNSSKSAYAIW